MHKEKQQPRKRKTEAKAPKLSEEMYRQMVENSLQGLAVIQDKRYVYCNRAFCESTGYSAAELMAFPNAGMLVHPEDREEVVTRFRSVVSGEAVCAGHEYRIIHKDGSVRWQRSLASVVEHNGAPAAHISQFDITEHRLAELALKESEERFHQITNTIDDIFYIFDAETETAIYLSPAFDRIWGFPREKALHQQPPFLFPVHPDDLEKVKRWAPTLKSLRKPFSYEYRIIRPDGSIRHIWDQGHPILGEDGEVKLFVGTGRDVTQRRMAEQEIQESKEYLNTIINCIGDAIIVKDRSHKLLLVNDAFCRYIGIPRERLMGTDGFERLPKDLAAFLFKNEEVLFQTETVGEIRETEDVLEGIQDRPITLMAKKSLLRDKTGGLQMVLAIRDITEYKKLETQLLQAQKMESIGVLAGGIAHDFNNLLNVINGYSELTLNALKPDNPLRADIEQIRDAGKRAATLTAQLLAFGRKQLLQPEILDLNDIIAHMSSMLARLIGEDIELITRTAPHLDWIHADRARIEQIIMNLAVNSRDAMPHGGKLTLETANVEFESNYLQHHRLARSGSYVMLAISDNGMGMSVETQEHMFDPFFTTKPKGKGTGLGLATVYGIVQQSNGHIWVYSEPDKGTTIKIYFPKATATREPVVEKKAIQSSFLGSETILLVEDEAAVRALAGRILRERGYIVMEASQGSEALTLTAGYKKKIDMIVTDIVMPGMSGRALVAEIVKQRPGIKILFISGYTDNAIVHHGMLDSGIAFLQKPFSVEGFARKVRSVLES